MGMRDLFDNVMLHLFKVLEENREAMQTTYRSFLPGTAGEFVIFKGRQANLPKYPVIEIIRGPIASAWSSTRVITETYNFFLDCSVKHASREAAGEFVATFGRAVHLLLNSFRNLRFDVPGVIGVRAFDSFADTSDPGFRRAAGERTSRVTWSCQVANLVNAPGVGNFIP